MVGLVQNGDLDTVQAHVALLDEVFEAARARHDDVDAGAQRRLLRLLAHATEDRGDGESGCRSQGLDGGGDLRRQLAGRSEHEAPGAAGSAARSEGAGQAGDEGEGERDGLAAAGAAAAEHVTTGERVGQRVALNREGFGLALTGEHVGQRRWHAEVEESRHRDAFGMARRRKGVKRATARVRASVRRMKRAAAEKAAKRDNDAGRREPPMATLARRVARRLRDRMLGIRPTHDETVITFPGQHVPPRSVGHSDRHPPFSFARPPRGMPPNRQVSQSLQSPHHRPLSEPYARRTREKTASRRSPRRTRRSSQVVRETGLLERARWFYITVGLAIALGFGGAITGFILLGDSWFQLLDRRGPRHPVHSGRVPLARGRAPHDLPLGTANDTPGSDPRQRHRRHEPRLVGIEAHASPRQPEPRRARTPTSRSTRSDSSRRMLRRSAAAWASSPGARDGCSSRC